jgi:nicotinamide mononucleotide transporter
MHLDPLETLAVIFGIVSVYLSVRENNWSWPTAIVNVTLYIFVFYRAGLYADMGLQVVYIAISVYGWYEWLHGGEQKTELKVSRAMWRLGGGLAAIGFAAAALLGTLLARTTNAALPYLDATTTATSLVAQWMMAKKLLENWLVWVAVDVVYIGMFLYST